MCRFASLSGAPTPDRQSLDGFTAGVGCIKGHLAARGFALLLTKAGAREDTTRIDFDYLYHRP